MKSKTTIMLIGLTAILSLMLAACTVDTECRRSTGIHLNVVFSCDSLRQSTDSARLAKDSLAMDTIRYSTISGLEIHGLGRDSILYTEDQTISLAKLPLRPDSLHSDFVLSFNGHTDTLTILHQNDMQFISLACGCMVFHTIDDVTGYRALQDYQLDRRYEGSYVVVAGERNDNLRQIRPQLEQTLAAASHVEASIGEQNFVRQAEADVLQNISDPEERRRLQELLKE